MQLRASELLGTDLVALAIWPDDFDTLPGGDGVGGMPVEARCVDLALAAALEDLVERDGPAATAAVAPGALPRAGRNAPPADSFAG